MTEEVTKPPKVFISYAWEDDVKPWVITFAKQLRKDGVEAVLDQWSAHYGDQLPEFMEKAVRESDFVILICTPKYKKKSDERVGGVGYEGNIITSEIFQKSNHRKFIPVLRKGTWGSALPSWAAGKLSMDLSGDPYSKKNYQDLLRALHGKWHTPPPIGKPPDFPDEEDEDAPPVTPQKKFISKDDVDKFVTSLRSFGRKLFPLLKVTGGLFIVGALFWAGSWAVPKFIALVPASQVAETATQFLVTQTASTSSLIVPTKTLRPTSIPTQARTPTALPYEITDAKGVTMRLVPAGEFVMGNDAGSADEKPAKVIYVDSFYIDKFEVTNKLYRECVNAGVCLPLKYFSLLGPHEYTGQSTNYEHREFNIVDYSSSEEFNDYPVVYADWNMAQNYCEWRIARLPTEAEWEKTSRGEKSLIYPWGNEYTCEYLNSFDFKRVTSNNGSIYFFGPSCDKHVGTTPVDSFSTGVSPYGVYNLLGNVSEWVSSLYKPYPYIYTVAENNSEVGTRVYRGGSYYANPSTSTHRYYAQEDYISTDLGFRCTYSP